MRALFLPMLLLLLTACATVQYSHDWDVTADFGRYRTYAWMPAPPDSTPANADAARAGGTLIERRVRAAVDAAMLAHGFSADEDHPDVRVAYHTGLKDKMNITDWGYPYAGNYWGWEGRDVDVENYTEGTLVVDLLDADSHDLVWRGMASGEIHPRSTPQERDHAMKQIVAKMFEEYPPKR
ncbi:MAG: DUF4136 domain-containing protein [Candidatus Krumholzibacteria bacterium]|nr:DUF4136 domain-containing protein [Candidatus Krumholzibacteria bacterium]MDH4337470.1 DUF4136 domain-containing protein [Candidatus Krumholzibacteria bacterium]MDH5270150.1 DUF4136 domain-containing protein [Candidatus Krumholzibacteria bacterium]